MISISKELNLNHAQSENTTISHPTMHNSKCTATATVKICDTSMLYDVLLHTVNLKPMIANGGAAKVNVEICQASMLNNIILYKTYLTLHDTT